MNYSRDGKTARVAVLCLFGVVFFAATSGSAFAQNLATNPRFNGNATPWVLNLSSSPQPAGLGASAYNAALDVDGQVGTSGSLQLDVTATTPTGTGDAEVAATECVAIPGGLQPVTEANYGARLRVPSGNPTDGLLSASVEVRFFSDGACNTPIDDAGESQGRTLGAGVPDDAFWYTLSDPAFIPASSLAAASMQVRLAVLKLADTGNAATVQFDNVYVSVNGTTPIQLQHFEVE